MSSSDVFEAFLGGYAKYGAGYPVMMDGGSTSIVGGSDITFNSIFGGDITSDSDSESENEEYESDACDQSDSKTEAEKQGIKSLIQIAMMDDVEGGQQETTVGGETVALAGGETVALAGGETDMMAGGETVALAGGETVALAGGETDMMAGGETVALAGGETDMMAGGETVALAGGVDIISMFNVSGAQDTDADMTTCTPVIGALDVSGGGSKYISDLRRRALDVANDDCEFGSDLYKDESKKQSKTKSKRGGLDSSECTQRSLGRHLSIGGGDLILGGEFFGGDSKKKPSAKKPTVSSKAESKKDVYVSAIDFDALDKYI